MELDIKHAKSRKSVATLNEISLNSTVGEVKQAIGRKCKKYADVNRQELRLDAKGKGLKDEATLEDLGVKLAHGAATLYFKDRGLQIGWSTVFLAEYAGPLLVYMLIYTRPWLLYGNAANAMYSPVANIAAVCWTGHYLKRILETIFVHHFSNATMPIGNLFKNCSYYWGFAAYVSYNINHPLFTPPKETLVHTALAAFLFCEFGNLSIHLLFKNLRPAGSKVRKIPYPNSNPLTLLFNLVSCPNYTYEIGSWIAFSVMTMSLPAGLFTLAGAYQMTVWALGKHRNYRKEFKDYPRRKAIIPFLI